MPNITIYISKDIHKELKKRKDINKSKIISDFLKKYLEENPK